MTETVIAWHFTNGNTLRDGRPVPPPGKWLVHDGVILPCVSGLHASERLIDALKYAPGYILHRVEVREEIHRRTDKLVGRERRILWSIDAEDVLREFARKQALSVAHFWDPPASVLAYLETGRGDRTITASHALRARLGLPWGGSTKARAAIQATVAACDNITMLAALDANWCAARATNRAESLEEVSGCLAARAAGNEMLVKMVEMAHEQ